MKINNKPVRQQGVETRQIIIDGQSVPALIFRFARIKQFMGAVIGSVFVWVLVVMFQHANQIQLEIKGIPIPIDNSVLVKIFCGAGALLFLWFTLFMIRRLFLPPFVALTPQGIFISQSRAPLFIEWTWITRLIDHQHERSRWLGIIIYDLQAKSSLKPFYKRMNWTADHMGFHYGIAAGPFAAKPDLFIFATEFFYKNPEKRALLGSEAGLTELENALRGH